MLQDAPSKSHSGHGLTWWSLWALLILLVFYPFSTGPVILLAEKCGIHGDFVTALYTPLIILCEHVPIVEDFFEWYIGDVWGMP